ncbi:feruloyl CoA ortho-hydroxylase F6H1-3 [Cryptomeria japonica]|uniref:feruloyl CoA ortho-hydroxylase F6H1-3 n=1 Tax=Cryptomeria japonica TaxID=3369 RepID=UPI0025AD0BC1|nr:feruloyl CoA ortho-hydroxylase F6H1-3 [Cryptomeria japonica]
MVCNYYPKCPEPECTLGVGSHTDPGWITALMQDDVTGLQVLHEDRWVTVKPIPHALVINPGDVLQILSNGKYKSAEHRATVSGSSDRISVGTTYGPSLNTIIRPAPELLLKGCKPVYREIVYKEYMEMILSGSLEDKCLLDFHRLEIH